MQADSKRTGSLRTKQKCIVWAVAQSLVIFLVAAWPWLCQASHKCSWMKSPGLAGTQMEDHIPTSSTVEQAKEQANMRLQYPGKLKNYVPALLWLQRRHEQITSQLWKKLEFNPSYNWHKNSAYLCWKMGTLGIFCCVELGLSCLT